VKGVGKGNKLIKAVSIFYPFHLNIVYETQPAKGFVGSALNQVAFQSTHENVGVRRCHFGAHCCATDLYVVLAIEHEVVQLKNMFKQLEK
jgi:hypothetical protein